jgi:phage/plasmid primase-like uncharacterized protein
MSSLSPNNSKKIDVEAVLVSVDIVDVIGAHVPLKKRGKTYTACCPFHDEKTPSFHVNREKQFYHCFGCGASGDAISFVRDYFRLEFVPACEQLAGKAVYVDQAQIEAAKARQAELRRLADEEEARIHAEIALKAEGLWAKCKPVDPKHPYLVRKGIKGYGLKQLRNMLVVPVRDESKKLCSLQFIRDKSQLSAKEIASGKDGVDG